MKKIKLKVYKIVSCLLVLLTVEFNMQSLAQDVEWRSVTYIDHEYGNPAITVT
jgi:hypothetical protein